MQQAGSREGERVSDARRAPPWNGEECKRNFDHFAARAPWTKGYASCDVDQLSAGQLEVKGTLPRTVRGTFYRNGPARHELGGQRYGHRWDGDGMIQAFRFGDELSHFGRFVRTAKYLDESAAGRFMHNAFGTYIPGTSPIPEDIDSCNVANINVCMAGRELLALWEPGSAYRIDPVSLDTIGVQTWREDLRSRPFSAHPKREPTGTLWNFGANPLTGELTIYCIDKDGSLQRSETLRVDGLPPLHDFAVTDHHLVFIMPPMLVNKERLQGGCAFGQACEWNPALSNRVLIVSKSDWSQRWFDLPPSMVFHIGNAWEDRAGVIRVQFMAASNPASLVAGWTIMHGIYKHRRGAFMAVAEIDTRSGRATQHVTEVEGEFPTVDPTRVGRRHGRVLCVGRSAARDAGIPGFDQLVLTDETGSAVQTYAFGPDWLVEEHVLVPDADDIDSPAQWAIGTALDMAGSRTVLSVFRATAIDKGPVAQASLPFALPLGLHGCFVRH